jgi:pimeloyl-ACP methyl ester carboxylesterase
MAMREFGDVIAYDQRGTGLSNAIPKCKTNYYTPLDEPLVRETEIALMRKAADECTVFWGDKGIDISGYNTVQNALDLDDLRRGLGVNKIDIWGISYGSHLALAAVKAMPEHIGRLVLAAIEGLDATVKYPARTGAYFKRLQAAIDANPETAATYPDLVAQMNRVHAQVEKAPLHITIKNKDGNEVTMAVGKVELQFVTSFFIADPARAAQLPSIYAMAEAGNVDLVAPLIYQFLRAEPITLTGMAEAMDIMSGISSERRELVKEQAKTSPLGDLLNFPMPHLVGALGLNDLGEGFRSPVKTDVPALFLTGTLDGRTYPEGAREAISGFTNGTQVMVTNGGHNVFMQDPKISEIILSYMRGQTVPTKVTLPLPDFPH